MTAVEEALTAWLDQNSNLLFALQDRYFEHTLTEAAARSSQAKVAAFIEDHERWLHLHQRAVSILSSNQVKNDVLFRLRFCQFLLRLVAEAFALQIFNTVNTQC